jgi:hypothetical protein
MKEELGGFLTEMGLTLSEEKTKITHITEGFTFLGYRVIREIGGSGKMVPKILIPDGAIKKFRHKVRSLLAPRTTNESVRAKITALNRFTAGWCQYYRCTSTPTRIFHKIQPEIFWGMAHWLGRKYKSKMPRIMRRFKSESTIRIGALQLTLPTMYKARLHRVKTWHNPYTEKAAIIREKLSLYDNWLITEGNKKGWMDLREEVIRLKGTVCALNLPDICESKGKPLHPSEIEIDHIIPRARFKDKTEADRMKHLQPLCTSCHRAKTKTDLKVLSRMR